MVYGKGVLEMLSYRARGPVNIRVFAGLVGKMFNKKTKRK